MHKRLFPLISQIQFTVDITSKESYPIQHRVKFRSVYFFSYNVLEIFCHSPHKVYTVDGSILLGTVFLWIEQKSHIRWVQSSWPKYFSL